MSRTLQETVASTLNALIKTLKDAEAGFSSASEDVTSADLKDLLRSFSCQRSQFAQALNRQVRKLHQQPEHSGSVAGTMHRGWIAFKAAAAIVNDSAILAECERGERAAVQSFRDALDSPILTGNVREIVLAQFAELQETYEQVQALRAVNIP
jgi:uncharacterized protein (TIGR02284 family)